jgi:HrpA-like RNA helicase
MFLFLKKAVPLCVAGNNLRATHVILDEVHERSSETDFLLITLREELRKRSLIDFYEKLPPMRLVLMSATADVDQLRSYFKGFGFSSHYENRKHPALDDVLPPFVSIAGRNHNVAEYFVEEIKEMFGVTTSFASEEDEVVFDDERARFVVAVVEKIYEKKFMEGAVLVFLPGMREIQQVAKLLGRSKTGQSLAVVRMHSSLPQSEINQAFVDTSPRRRVVLATSIAES